MNTPKRTFGGKNEKNCEFIMRGANVFVAGHAGERAQPPYGNAAPTTTEAQEQPGSLPEQNPEDGPEELEPGEVLPEEEAPVVPELPAPPAAPEEQDAVVAVQDEEVAVSAFQPGDDGSAEKPFQISTITDLKVLADAFNDGTNITAYQGKHYKLTADLDFEDQEQAWLPIAKGETGTFPFDGVFDGAGHSIKRFVLSSADDNIGYYGFFGKVSGGTVKNLTLKASNFEFSVSNKNFRAAGALAGLAENATIENCVVEDVWMSTCNVTATGGLVGWAKNSTIKNSIARVYMETANALSQLDKKEYTKDDYFISVGGIAGQAQESGVLGCYVGNDPGRIPGAVDIRVADNGSAMLGGIVGYLVDDGAGGKDAKALVKDCLSAVDIVGGPYTGGIVGSANGKNADNQCEITDCVASGTVDVWQKYHWLGGIVGLSNGSVDIEDSAAVMQDIGSERDGAELYMGGRVLGARVPVSGTSVEDVYGYKYMSKSGIIATWPEDKAASQTLNGKDMTIDNMKSAQFWKESVDLDFEDANSGWTIADNKLPVPKMLALDTSDSDLPSFPPVAGRIPVPKIAGVEKSYLAYPTHKNGRVFTLEWADALKNPVSDGEFDWYVMEGSNRAGGYSVVATPGIKLSDVTTTGYKQSAKLTTPGNYTGRVDVVVQEKDGAGWKPFIRFTVELTGEATSVQLSSSELKMAPGQARVVSVVGVPANFAVPDSFYKSISCKSSNEAVATVSDIGTYNAAQASEARGSFITRGIKITALAKGTATITVSGKIGTATKSVTCVVNVVDETTDFTIEPKTPVVRVGSRIELEAVPLSPENMLDENKIEWALDPDEQQPAGVQMSGSSFEAGPVPGVATVVATHRDAPAKKVTVKVAIVPRDYGLLKVVYSTNHTNPVNFFYKTISVATIEICAIACDENGNEITGAASMAGITASVDDERIATVEEKQAGAGHNHPVFKLAFHNVGDTILRLVGEGGLETVIPIVVAQSSNPTKQIAFQASPKLLKGGDVASVGVRKSSGVIADIKLLDAATREVQPIPAGTFEGDFLQQAVETAGVLKITAPQVTERKNYILRLQDVASDVFTELKLTVVPDFAQNAAECAPIRLTEKVQTMNRYSADSYDGSFALNLTQENTENKKMVEFASGDYTLRFSDEKYRNFVEFKPLQGAWGYDIVGSQVFALNVGVKIKESVGLPSSITGVLEVVKTADPGTVLCTVGDKLTLKFSSALPKKGYGMHVNCVDAPEGVRTIFNHESKMPTRRGINKITLLNPPKGDWLKVQADGKTLELQWSSVRKTTYNAKLEIESEDYKYIENGVWVYKKLRVTSKVERVFELPQVKLNTTSPTLYSVPEVGSAESVLAANGSGMFVQGAAMKVIPKSPQWGMPNFTDLRVATGTDLDNWAFTQKEKDTYKAANAIQAQYVVKKHNKQTGSFVLEAVDGVVPRPGKLMLVAEVSQGYLVKLPVTVKLAGETTKVTLTAAKKSLTLNPNLAGGDSVTVALGTNIKAYPLAQNASEGRVKAVVLDSTGKKTPPLTSKPVRAAIEGDKVRIYTQKGWDMGKTYKVQVTLANAYLDKNGTPKNASVTITVKTLKEHGGRVKALPTFKGKVTGKLDFVKKTQPLLTATVGNYNGRIVDFASITLKTSTGTDLVPASDYIRLTPRSANSWSINYKNTIARGKYTLELKGVTLDNGDVYSDATLKVNFEVVASKWTVPVYKLDAGTLYSGDPHSRTLVVLPKMSDGQVLDMARISLAPYKDAKNQYPYTLTHLGDMGYYAVYAIGFKNEAGIDITKAKGKTLTINLWLEQDMSDKPTATVKVKVNVKHTSK